MTSTYYSQQWNDETIDQAASHGYRRVPGSGPRAGSGSARC